jgi:hypothetical protein
MPTLRTFHAKLSLQTLIPVINSVGAHISAKLQHFASDERTLTDELCDMFCIWSQRRFSRGASSIPPAEKSIIDRLPKNVFDVNLSKVTPDEEAKIGADLELVIEIPKGIKRALLQAKVQDPKSGRLRYASVKGRNKLRAQLADMRADNGELSFLLIYVPSGELDAKHQGFGTYEQQLPPVRTTSVRSSKFGTTVISVDDLIDERNRRRYSKIVESLGDGIFTPAGCSLSKLVLEMVLCAKGKWISPSNFEGMVIDRQQQPRPYRSLTLSLGGVSLDQWEELIIPVRRMLDAGEIS